MIKGDVIFFHAGKLADWVRKEAEKKGQSVAEFMRRMIAAAQKEDGKGEA